MVLIGRAATGGHLKKPIHQVLCRLKSSQGKKLGSGIQLFRKRSSGKMEAWTGNVGPDAELRPPQVVAAVSGSKMGVGL